MTQKTLYIIRGIVGTGKTELATRLGACAAADDYPGLYINGIYQSDLQKASHEDCFKRIKEYVEAGIPYIAVHNTFAQLMYLKPYVDLGIANGYAVHVIHTEAVILPGGDSYCPEIPWTLNLAKSEHNVAPAIIESMQDRWEPFISTPKKGMSIPDLSQEMSNLVFPDVILFDKEGTVTMPLNGRVFQQGENDFQFTPEFTQWSKRQYADDPDLYMISNQCGVSTGHKSVEVLKREIECFASRFLAEFDLLFRKCFFATRRNGHDCLACDWNNPDDMPEWENNGSLLRADKPGAGMFELILNQRRNLKDKEIWVVGNAYLDKQSEDWQFAKKCQSFPIMARIRFIPIHMLNICWDIVAGTESRN